MNTENRTWEMSMEQMKPSSDKDIERTAQRLASEAIRNIRLRELGDLWLKVQRSMSEARLKSESTMKPDTPNDVKTRLTARMLGIRDSFIILYARTEALLPAHSDPSKSKLKSEDLGFYESVNDRLHVMDMEYRRFMDALPVPYLTDSVKG